MTFAARPSLRARLTAVAGLGSAVVLAVGAALFYLVLTARLDRALSDELAVRAGDVEVELAAGDAVSLGGPLPTQVLDSTGGVVDPAGEKPLVDVGVVRDVMDRDDDVELDFAGQRLLLRPVEQQGRELLIVVAGSTASITQARNQLLAGLAAAGPAVVIGVTVSAWLLTGAALSPVQSMTRRASRISVASPGERLPEPPGDDEIAELAATLNGMLDRITQSVRHERAFIDDASHELRTPVAVLRGELELLASGLRHSGADPELIDGVTSALEETDRLTRLADQLLVLARIDAGELSEVQDRPVRDLHAAVSEVVGRLAPTTAASMEIDVDPTAAPALDVDSFDRMLTNLVVNATRFAASKVVVVGRREDGRMELLVADDGPGFPESVLSRPFERFGRADPQRTGTGLGLAIVDAIARAAGGRATLGNGGRAGGAWVRVELPVRRPRPGSH